MTLKEDINTRFQQTLYCFEVYSEDYHFRVLMLYYSEEFPITLKVDEGIRSELNVGEKITIRNNKEFQRQIKEILTCQKMRLILMRMMESSQVTKSDGIMEYLKLHPVCTYKEIGDAIGITFSTVQSICNMLIEEKRITVRETGAKLEFSVCSEGDS